MLQSGLVNRIGARYERLTDDLTPNQFQALLHWLWLGNHPVTRANVKGWRRRVGLPVGRLGEERGEMIFGDMGDWLVVIRKVRDSTVPPGHMAHGV